MTVKNLRLCCDFPCF